jgi:hypothetical protein
VPGADVKEVPGVQVAGVFRRARALSTRPINGSRLATITLAISS